MGDNRSEQELLNDTVLAYEESTGDAPDTRDYVAIEDAVKDYMKDK